MIEIRGYTIDAEIGRGPDSVVYSARNEADGSARAIRASKLLPIDSVRRMYRRASALEQQARLLERLTLADAAGIARVYEAGRLSGGCYYVTDPFDASLRQWISSRVRHSDRSISAIVDGVLTGLESLRDHEGRPHAELRASNILLTGDPNTDEFLVALADPRPATNCDGAHSEKSDLEWLGKHVYSSITHHVPSGPVPLPVEYGVDWGRLGKPGRRWCEFCNRLLTPADQGGLATISEAREEFERIRWRSKKKQRLALAGSSAALAAAGAVATMILLYEPERPRECPEDVQAWGRWCVASGETFWFTRLSREIAGASEDSELRAAMVQIMDEEDLPLLDRITELAAAPEWSLDPRVILPEAQRASQLLFSSPPTDDEFIDAITDEQWCAIEDASSVIDGVRRSIDEFLREQDEQRREFESLGLSALAAIFEEHLESMSPGGIPEDLNEEATVRTVSVGEGEEESEGVLTRDSFAFERSQRVFLVDQLIPLVDLAFDPVLTSVRDRSESIEQAIAQLRTRLGASDAVVQLIAPLVERTVRSHTDAGTGLGALNDELAGLVELTTGMTGLTDDMSLLDIDRFRSESPAYAQGVAPSIAALERWTSEAPMYQVVTDDPRTDIDAWRSTIAGYDEQLDQIGDFDNEQASAFRESFAGIESQIAAALSGARLLRKDVAILDDMERLVAEKGNEVQASLEELTGQRDEFLAELASLSDQDVGPHAQINEAWVAWSSDLLSRLANDRFRIDPMRTRVRSVRTVLTDLPDDRPATLEPGAEPSTLTDSRRDEIARTVRARWDSTVAEILSVRELDTIPDSRESRNSLWREYDDALDATVRLLATLRTIEDALDAGYAPGETLASRSSSTTLDGLATNAERDDPDRAFESVSAPVLARLDDLRSLESVSSPSDIADRVRRADLGSIRPEEAFALWRRTPSITASGVPQHAEAELALAEHCRALSNSAESLPLVTGQDAERARLERIRADMEPSLRARWIAYADAASRDFDRPDDLPATIARFESLASLARPFGIDAEAGHLDAEPSIEYNLHRATFQSFIRDSADEPALEIATRELADRLQQSDLAARLDRGSADEFRTLIDQIQLQVDPNREPSFDPDVLPAGPGLEALTGIRYAGDGDLRVVPPDSLSYRLGEGENDPVLAFRLVSDRADGPPFLYVAVDEMPIRAVARILETTGLQDLNATAGPDLQERFGLTNREARTALSGQLFLDPRAQDLRTWVITDRGTLGSNPRWFQVWTGAGNANGVNLNYYPPALQDVYRRPEFDTPVSWIKPQAAAAVCAAIGCRLPTVDEYRSAVTAFGGVESLVSSSNLRDETWQTLQSHVVARREALASAERRDDIQIESYPYPSIQMFVPYDPSTNSLMASFVDEREENASRVRSDSDGVLWFANADHRDTGSIRNLVGNVHELVTTERVDVLATIADEDGTLLEAPHIVQLLHESAVIVNANSERFAVIGGSAISPAPDGSQTFITPYRINPKPRGGFSDDGVFPDVGFRPAFTLDEDFEPPLATRLADLLSASNYLSTRDG